MLNYTISGQGSTALLFIHGWGGNSSWWNNQRDYFSHQYTIAQMDLPGHGQSTLPSGELTSKVYAEAIKTVAEKLPGDLILVGHSMSGAYVLEPVLKLPNLKQLIIVDTLKNLDQVFTFEQADQFLFAQYRKDYKSSIENVMPQFLFSPKSPEDVKKQILGEFLKLDGEYAIKLLSPLYKMDTQSLAKNITVPVRAINSDYTPTDVEANRKYFKDYEVEIVANAGHYPMLERPEEFNRILERILNA